MTPEGVDKNFDSVLNLFNVKIEIDEKEIADIHKADARVLIDRMCIMGLITGRTFSNSDSGRTFILAPFGSEVKRHGSWTKYLSDKAEDNRLATEQIKSSILANKTTIFILVITFLVSVASAYILIGS